MESIRSNITRTLKDLHIQHEENFRQYMQDYISKEAYLDRCQAMSQLAGVNFYDAYHNLEWPDDLVGDCLDFYRHVRREIPKREGAEFLKTGKRPGSWEAYLTTQEGEMTA